MIDKGFWEGSETAHSPLASLSLDALRDVLLYLYDIEKTYWIANGKERDHIFIQIEKMLRWYNEHIYTIENAKGLNDMYYLIKGD